MLASCTAVGVVSGCSLLDLATDLHNWAVLIKYTCHRTAVELSQVIYSLVFEHLQVKMYYLQQHIN